MVRLLTLGGMSLENAATALDDRQTAALAELSRRKRKLALLVVLARTPRPLSRDLLTDMFWPEDDPARARHSLNEALSHIRRVLGADALGARGADVALAPQARLWTDAAAFASAAANGDAVGAVSLYGGPFLEGVYLDGAPRFEEWTSRQRDQLRRVFVASCAEACQAPLTPANAGTIADVARRWLDEAPESSIAAQRWVQALAFPDTREGLRSAMDAYARVCHELDEQLGTGPDAALAALGARLQQRAATHFEPAAERTVTPAPAALPTASRAEPAAMPATGVATPSSPPPPWWRRPAPAISLLLAAGALAATLAWNSRRAGRAGAADARPWLLVAATSAPIGADSANLRKLVGLAIETSLAADDALDVLPPRRVRNVLQLMGRPDSSTLDEPTAIEIAARTGVGFIVVPSLLQVGKAFTVSARVLTPDGGEVIATMSSRANSADDLLRTTRGDRGRRWTIGAALTDRRAPWTVAAPGDDVLAGRAAALRHGRGRAGPIGLGDGARRVQRGDSR